METKKNNILYTWEIAGALCLTTDNHNNGKYNHLQVMQLVLQLHTACTATSVEGGESRLASFSSNKSSATRTGT